MPYSFITPRKKPLLDSFSWLWTGFIVLMSIGLIAFYLFMLHKTDIYRQEYSQKAEKNEKLKRELADIRKKLKIDKMQIALHHEVQSANTLLEKSIRNLFDLVPDQITLKKVVMEKESLFLTGITPTKDAYNLLLAPPLKSIFNQSEVKFTPIGKEGYLFESRNSIKHEGE